ncbi:6819_t:CDS:2 [Entrophospora sp. SA101]|nr:5993_t:CDS:2 [Entrophospora sp. SA101]CAJ0640267.1 7421_t:CDS:2 [Entrophospora sp. SA101]CAJ0751162.1 6819_t:CDS:2 [Entrophospora sp. SA101]CAJ0846606.1 8176_t:CDS:2 [Entrophospora sp. SA101]CAJ0896247.1 13076_t:CDS:2 [Entrophospora sp. SA101]
MNNIKAAVSLSSKNKIMSDNIEVNAEQVPSIHKQHNDDGDNNGGNNGDKINFIHYRNGDIEPLNQKSSSENTIGTCSFYETHTNQQFDFKLKFN